MNPAIDRALAILRDIPGVEGSFVVDEVGSVVARDPAMGLPEWLLAGAATRLSTLVESSDDAFESPRDLTLVFGDRTIVVRISAPYLLALLVRPTASMEAVRLASNVALRQVARALLSPPAAGVAPPSSEPAYSAPPSSPTLTSPGALPQPNSQVVSTGANLPRSGTVTLKSPSPSVSSAPNSAASPPKSGAKPVVNPAAVAPKKKKSDIWG